MNSLLRPTLLLAVPLLATACTTTTGYRHKDGSVTISQRGLKASETNYWIVGARPGQVTRADDLKVFRKMIGKGQPAVPLKCQGFIDTSRETEIGVRLLERKAGAWHQSWVNGRHKLIDETAPRPFYHWLIP